MLSYDSRVLRCVGLNLIHNNWCICFFTKSSELIFECWNLSKNVVLIRNCKRTPQSPTSYHNMKLKGKY